MATEELSALLGSHVGIEEIDISTLSRIQLRGVTVKEPSGEQIASINRLSVSFDILPLFSGKVRINTVQLFGFTVSLRRDTPGSELNIRYIIDKFAGNDDGGKKIPDLRINYVLLRKGQLAYDVMSADSTPGIFNPSHIRLRDISANISLKTLNSDSLNANVRRLEFMEQSGLGLKKATLRVRANKNRLLLDDFVIDVGNSALNVDSVWLEDRDGDLMRLSPASPSYGIEISDTRVKLDDLAYFDTHFGGMDRELRASARLTGSGDAVQIHHLDLQIDDDFDFHFISSFDTVGVYARVERCHATSSVLNMLPIDKDNVIMPEVIDVTGEVSGNYSDMSAKFDVASSIGDLAFNSVIGLDRSGYVNVKSANVGTDCMHVDSLLPKSGLADIAFDLHLNFVIPVNNISLLALDSELDIHRLVFGGYEYHDIYITAKAGNRTYQTAVMVDDANVNLDFTGEYAASGDVPTVMSKLSIDGLDLYALNIIKDERYRGGRLSLGMDAGFSGLSVDDFTGQIGMHDIDFTVGGEAYHCSSFAVGVDNAESGKSMYVNSDFFNAYVKGNYYFSRLPQSIRNIAAGYLPSIAGHSAGDAVHGGGNDFRFGFEVIDTELLNKVFGVPVNIYGGKITANGYLDDTSNQLRVDCFVPQIYYSGKHFESSLLRIESSVMGLLDVYCRSNVSMKNGSVMSVSMHSSLANDCVNTDLFWGNNKAETYSGNLSLDTRLSRHDDGKVRVEVGVNDCGFILKDSCWTVRPSKIVIDSGKVAISRFRIEHLDQYIDIDGTISHDLQDSVFVDLRKIDMSYIFELANIRRVVDFSGDVTGMVYANGILSTLRLNADMDVMNFCFNGSRLGDMKLRGGWDNEKRGILIDADIDDYGKAFTKVNGAVYPIKPGSVDITIKTSHADIGFLRKYMASISSDISGRASGEIRIKGPFKGGITLTGNAVAEKFKFKIDLLNTYISTSDSVHFLHDKIFLDNILVTDGLGNRGRATVNLFHTHLKDMRYDVNATIDNMLVIDRQESIDFPFYGKIFASGRLNINGGAGTTNVNASMRTGQNSTFSYLVNSTSTATNNQFVTFVDKTNYRRNEQIYIPRGQNYITKEETKKISSDVRLNLDVEATPGIYIKLIMDRVAGDYIGGTGSGNIRIDYYNKGDVKMYGNYTIDKGIYKFSIQEVIRKDFIINSGSSIAFNGSPLNADLDIDAYYTVNSVSLQDLGSDVVSQTGQSNVKVNCTMNLSGMLTRPEIKLGLELPNEGEEVQRTVLNAISTDEQMNMQILYLLSIGKFYVSEYNADNTNQSSNALSSVLSSTISGQLNNMFSNLIDNNNWNIGTNLSTGSDGWTDVEFEGMLSGQLLNNRLLINGNFGYRDNALSQNNFVGDFEVEYLLDRMGNFRLKAYNRTNDRYYTKTTLTTQGLGIVFKRDFDNFRDLFDFSIWKRRDREKTDTVTINE